MAAFTTIALAAGTAAAVGSSVAGIAGARKAEKKAEKASKNATQISNQAAQALAAREELSRVPGFGDSDNIPGYSSPLSGSVTPAVQQRALLTTAQLNNLNRRDAALGRPVPLQLGSVQNRQEGDGPVFEQSPYDRDIGDDASRTIIQETGNPMSRGFQEAMRMGYDPTTGISTRGQIGRNDVVISDELKAQFEEITQTLPKTPQGKPIFPDPNTEEGKNFYAKLPKSIADMASDPRLAQMYKGSNIVNPYANVRDLSAIAEDRSDLITDRTGLLSDRTDLIQDRTELLEDRTGMFESATGLAQDLSAGQEDLSGRVVDLRRGAQDFSGLASDTSVLASNAFANLQVATQAADLQAQQSDQALANTLSTIRATGAGAGGATAIAQAALQSKLNISATIEQQEARNVQARAQGQQQVEMIRMNEGRRLQDIALSEKLRLEGLREREGLRIDETRLGEGRALRDLSVSEGRRLQELAVAERLREQGISFDESLRLQQARFDTAREQDRFRFDEAGRLQEASFNEAGRLQQVQLAEALRVQEAQMSEQQRLQQADAMAREYQFRVAETREQNRLNRLANQETQAAQNAASLEASAVAAEANRKGAVVGGLASLAGTALSVGAAGGFGTKVPPITGTTGGAGATTATGVFSDRRLKKNIKLIGKSNSGLNIYAFEYINKIFGSGIYQGVMSNEIPQYAVIKHTNGYDKVDYSKIDVDFKEI
jgi:hypothetical protein